MLQQTMDFIQKTKPDYVYMCEAVPYPGTELYYAIKQMGIEMSKDWNLYHEDTQVFKNPLVTHEQLVETKKQIYDDFFSPTYYLQKRFGKNIYSKTMARMALNHLVWKYRLTRWAFKKLGAARQQKKSKGGYSRADEEQQI